MQIYLPIADLPVNIFVILAIGLAVGFISGMFGIGGGFLTTPLLIFLGIPPSVAVATVTCHIAGTTFSARDQPTGGGTRSIRARDHVVMRWPRRRRLRRAGCSPGCARIGQLDFTIGISYVLLLGMVGTLMIVESARAISRARHGRPTELRRPGSHAWFHGLPFKFRFKRSHIYGSIIPVW